jgi:hypothetical protein
VSPEIQVGRLGPGIFTVSADGNGVPAAYTVRVKPGGAQINEDVFVFNQGTGKFEPREIDLSIAGDQVFLILFGTGFRNYNSLNNVIVRFGNAEQQAAAALPQGTYVGLDQLNVFMDRTKIPSGTVYPDVVGAYHRTPRAK